jgi:hypothetical protein
MDLANMRANGVHSIAVYCLDCDHRTDVDVDHYRHIGRSNHLKIECGAEAAVASGCTSGLRGIRRLRISHRVSPPWNGAIV